jgi:TPR repeat protein
LFKQPESNHLGDCPICCLPLPLSTVAMTTPCCSKRICNGCAHTNYLREEEERQQHSCPFCRQPVSMSVEKVKAYIMKRIEANDPVAMCQMGSRLWIEGDYSVALEYFTKAAGLGNVDAHYNLACMYGDGKGAENEKKEIFHLEQAAIGGHPGARHMLGCKEWDNGKIERAVKHFIIAANLGHDTSLKRLRECYVKGHVSKEEFAAALRAHQAAVDATKSPLTEGGSRCRHRSKRRFEYIYEGIMSLTGKDEAEG